MLRDNNVAKLLDHKLAYHVRSIAGAVEAKFAADLWAIPYKQDLGKTLKRVKLGNRFSKGGLLLDENIAAWITGYVANWPGVAFSPKGILSLEKIT